MYLRWVIPLYFNIQIIPMQRGNKQHKCLEENVQFKYLNLHRYLLLAAFFELIYIDNTPALNVQQNIFILLFCTRVTTIKISSSYMWLSFRIMSLTHQDNFSQRIFCSVIWRETSSPGVRTYWTRESSSYNSCHLMESPKCMNKNLDFLATQKSVNEWNIKSTTHQHTFLFVIIIPLGDDFKQAIKLVNERVSIASK